MRAPDFLIGPPDDPYLRRWWIIPRNRWFNIYLHHIRHSDDDRALHDHPWFNCSILLRGGYLEVMAGGRAKWARPGSITFRRASCPHRIKVYRPDVWSLFITGPVIREWGFHCPKGWVHWKRFVSERDSGQIGAGCEG